MKNTETADVFAGMPKSRVLKMWRLYRRETEALLRQSVPNWILQENRDLLRNFSIPARMEEPVSEWRHGRQPAESWKNTCWPAVR